MSRSPKDLLPQVLGAGGRGALGFVVLPVVLALILIAAVALLMTYEGTLNVHLVAGQTEASEAGYLAEAGLAHAKWQLAQNTSCSGYTNLPATAFSSHTYSAALSATSSSPLTISATGTHASGITRTLTATVHAFQPATSLTLQPDPTAGKDGWVASNHPTYNYGTTTEMTISGGAQQQHFLIQFDLTAIPPDATIRSARLEMYLNTASADPAAEFTVYRMTEAWAEGTGDNWNPGDGANWNTADGSTTWNWASNHDAANPMAVTPVNPTFTGWHAWDITRLVQQWTGGVAPNHGLVIKGNANTVNAWFYSSDRSTAALRPKLTLTYACECGISCSPAPSSMGYYLDRFPNFTCDGPDEYAGSNGTLDWSPNVWQEVGDDGRACGANLRVVQDPLIADPTGNRLRLQNKNRTMTRAVDLSGFATANFRFDYRRDSLPVGASVGVAVSGDGGSTWVVLGTIADGNDTSYQSLSYDISAFIAADTQIAFSTNNNFGNEVYIDNVQVGDPATPNGPIAHWKLDDGSGATAVDSAGGHDGALTNGPTWDAGKLDGALNFDGNNDYIAVPHDDTLSLTTFSISAWIRPTALSGWQILVNKGTTTSAVNYYLGTNGDEIGLGFYNAGWVEFNTTSADLATNQWYHIAATFDDSAGEGRIYLDGTLVHASTTTKSPLPNSDGLTIGRSGFGEYWPGLLDDVRIYDRLLGAPEVAILAGGGGCAGTLRDEFNAQSYVGSDGTLSWAGPWAEVGESDGPTSGDVRVMNDQSNYQLRLGNKNNGLERGADLSGYATATLEFDYRREQLNKADEYVQIEISDNGGSSWTELGQVSDGADSDYQSMSYDISDYIAADTRIRFVTSNKVDADDIVYFDNVEICVGN